MNNISHMNSAIYRRALNNCLFVFFDIVFGVFNHHYLLKILIFKFIFNQIYKMNYFLNNLISNLIKFSKYSG